MRLWADACVTPQLEGVAHQRGYEATCNRTRGVLAELDPDLYPRIVDGDWVLVTNNEKDFRRLAAEYELHPGLIVLPQSLVDTQKEHFGRVLDYIEHQAADAGETPGDWMVCRLITYDEDALECDWEWLP